MANFASSKEMLIVTSVALTLLFCGPAANSQNAQGAPQQPQTDASKSAKPDLTVEQIKELLRTNSSSQPKVSPKIVNPHASSNTHNAIIVPILRKQKETAEAERAEILSHGSSNALSGNRGNGAAGIKPPGPTNMGTRGAQGTPPPCPPGQARPITATGAAPCVPITRGNPPVGTAGPNDPCPPGTVRSNVSLAGSPAPCIPAPNPPTGAAGPNGPNNPPNPCPPGMTVDAAGRPCSPTGGNPSTGGGRPGNPANPAGSNPSAGASGGSSNPSPTLTPASTPQNVPKSGGGQFNPALVGGSVAIAPVAAVPSVPAAKGNAANPPANSYMQPNLAGKANQSIAMPCAMQKTTVSTVNGQAKGTVFTPDPTYNSYTIKGCNFGDTQGEAHLNGPFAAGQVKLQIEFWSDTQIVAKVDPTISGELDQDNVSLLIAPVSGPQTQAPGFKFYAARESVQLKSMPQSGIDFAAVKDNVGYNVQPAYISPSAGYYGAMSEVHRISPSSAFGGNHDYYDFTGLTAGFTTDSFQVWSTDLKPQDCTAVYATAATLYIDAHLTAAWLGENIQVNFGEQHCHVSQAYGLGSKDFGQSHYGLIVWVTGPRGVEPSCATCVVKTSRGSSDGGEQPKQQN